MAKKEAQKTLDIFDYYDPTALVAAVCRLQEGEYISGVELAAILEANPDKVLPPEFRQYLVRFLLGKPADRCHERALHACILNFLKIATRIETRR